MPRERQIYRETYKKGTALGKSAVPVLKHVTNPNYRTVGADLLAAGQIERADGSVVDYHDLRVYIQVGP